MEFQAWPKIPRHTGFNVIISEKIDGTNACINVGKDLKIQSVQSRTRLIDIHNDNFGFANWVVANKEVLESFLGEGRHYGEWAGPGIQNNPLKLTQKTFFLFNTHRWEDKSRILHPQVTVVDRLFIGTYYEGLFAEMMDNLWSVRQIDDQLPEGIIIYWPQTRTMEKMTYANSEGKWKQ